MCSYWGKLKRGNFISRLTSSRRGFAFVFCSVRFLFLFFDSFLAKSTFCLYGVKDQFTAYEHIFLEGGMWKKHSLSFLSGQKPQVLPKRSCLSNVVHEIHQTFFSLSTTLSSSDPSQRGSPVCLPSPLKTGFEMVLNLPLLIKPGWLEPNTMTQLAFYTFI